MITIIYNFFRHIIQDSFSIYWTLLKIVVPVMILVRIGIAFDLHVMLARLMAPLMTLVDLPPETSLIVVTTLFAGMYGGATIMVGMVSSLDMTVAQATVLTSIMIIVHALPMEQPIVRWAGVRLVPATLLRLAVAFSLGWLLQWIYGSLNILQQPMTIAWAPDTRLDAPWLTWAMETAVSLGMILGIILALITVLRLFDVTGLTRLLATSLSPFLSVMGIAREATSLTMTGALLGLMFGGGLIIREARTGKLGHRTIFLSLMFMSLCHGLIEDTIFAMLLGGHISGVLFARVALVVVVMIFVNKLIRITSDQQFYRWFFKPIE